MARAIAAIAVVIAGSGCRAPPTTDAVAQPTPSVDLRSVGALIDVHEHIGSVPAAKRLLRAMDHAGVVRAVVVASGQRTLTGRGPLYGGIAESNALVLALGRTHRERLIPFVAVDPADPAHLTRLQQAVERGARGLKLYSGHSAFHRLPLDHPKTRALYAFCEREGLPVLFHVNSARYERELSRVLDEHPALRVNCPHFCLAVAEPKRLERLLARHRNLWIDVSFGERNAALGREVVERERTELRRIIARFADRLLFGADLIIGGQSPEEIVAAWRDYLALLVRPRYRDSAGRTHAGLGLPDRVMRQIARDNARRWLGE